MRISKFPFLWIVAAKENEVTFLLFFLEYVFKLITDRLFRLRSCIKILMQPLVRKTRKRAASICSRFVLLYRKGFLNRTNTCNVTCLPVMFLHRSTESGYFSVRYTDIFILANPLNRRNEVMYYFSLWNMLSTWLLTACVCFLNVFAFFPVPIILLR